jgi:hypothetical protein
LASAVGKLLDNRGFSEALLTYRLFPEGWLLELGLAISLFELVLGLWILSGTRLSWSAIVAALLHLQFVVIATVSNVRGLDIPNCGCFGVFAARPMTWMTVAEDAGLFAMCLVIVWRARYLPAWVSVRFGVARGLEAQAAGMEGV